MYFDDENTAATAGCNCEEGSCTCSTEATEAPAATETPEVSTEETTEEAA